MTRAIGAPLEKASEKDFPGAQPVKVADIDGVRLFRLTCTTHGVLDCADCFPR